MYRNQMDSMGYNSGSSNMLGLVLIFVAAGITANLLSLIGAVYYIFFVGVVSTGLLILLAVYVVLTAGFIYAWRKYDRTGAMAPTGSSVKSA